MGKYPYFPSVKSKWTKAQEYEPESTPSNPNTNNYKLYFKSDGSLYKLDSSGTESSVGASSSSVNPSILVINHSTTIGDYTSPTVVTSSSDVGGGSTPEVNLDLSNNTGWNFSNSETYVSGGTLHVTANSSGDQNNCYYDIYSALGNNYADNTTGWVLRFKVMLNSYTNNGVGQAVACFFGLWDINNPVNESPTGTYCSFMTSVHASGSTGNTYLRNSNTGVLTEASFSEPATKTWWIEITYNASTDTLTQQKYSDEYVTTDGSLSTQNSIGSMPNLRYILGRMYYQSVSDSNDVQFDDIKFYNGITTVTTSSNPKENLNDDNTSTFWKSDPETNPYVYLDMGSNQNCNGISIYPHSDTTETEIKIQTSDDAITWSDVRKITFTNLTNASWNYIRFNNSLSRYIRIYGNSGLSKTLAINEAKVMTKTDSELIANHGHLEISSSDTSLGLDGT